MKSKKFYYTWEDYEDGDKNAKTMIADILADGELGQLEELVIGCWGESWENSAQSIIDGLVKTRISSRESKVCLSVIWIMRNARCRGSSRRIMELSGRRCHSWKS